MSTKIYQNLIQVKINHLKMSEIQPKHQNLQNLKFGSEDQGIHSYFV